MAAPSDMNLSQMTRALWAKSGDESGWLSLPQHMADSADVASRVWDEFAAPQLRSACATSCGLSEDETRTLYRLVACLHDLGKASEFQFQLEKRGGEFSAFTDRIAAAGLPLDWDFSAMEPPFKHGTAGYAIATRILRRRYGLSAELSQSLGLIIDAHHGLPSETAAMRAATRAIRLYPSEWQDVWEELVTFAISYVGAESLLDRLQEDPDIALFGPAQTLLCGLVIMADWIASNQDAFPMSPTSPQSERAHVGWELTDLPPAWKPRFGDNAESAVRFKFDLPLSASIRPVQLAAIEQARQTTSPSLMIIEAPTGEGKTEAALAAAEIIAERSEAGGLFFAAPTMSTSDALFTRVMNWTRRVTGAGEVNSMYLSHSKSTLNPDYQSLKRNSVGIDEPEQAGSVVAAQWLRGRKRGLLANMVVGTVDQVLMMALQSRHLMLRHIAFAGKVVVIDEVHAYDAYMNAYLAAALQWLARYGVSVIMLSATLPRSTKQHLIGSYEAGLTQDPKALATSSVYPLISVVSSDEFVEHPVPPRPNDACIHTQFIEDDLDTLVQLLSDETASGGCVLVLCNSVIRAQAVLEALTPQLREHTCLLHARFMASDRLTKERELVSQLGPKAVRGNGRPGRLVLIATQVAEQSLDIDVDLLITDIAPIDLVLQRAGRLHRHRRSQADRPEPLREPRMFIRGILKNTGDSCQFDPHAESIYGRKSLMAALSELNALADGQIRRPQDVPGLVQRAYAETVAVPDGWRESWQLACAEDTQRRAELEAKAKAYRIPLPEDAAKLPSLFRNSVSGRDSHTSAEEQGQAQVRDIEPTIEVILVRDDASGYKLMPTAENATAQDLVFSNDAPVDPDISFRLARCSVRLPRRIVLADLDALITTLEHQTPLGWQKDPNLRGLLALRLNDQLETNLFGHQLQYSETLGLSVNRLP